MFGSEPDVDRGAVFSFPDEADAFDLGCPLLLDPFLPLPEEVSLSGEMLCDLVPALSDPAPSTPEPDLSVETPRYDLSFLDRIVAFGVEARHRSRASGGVFSPIRPNQSIHVDRRTGKTVELAFALPSSVEGSELRGPSEPLASGLRYHVTAVDFCAAPPRRRKGRPPHVRAMDCDVLDTRTHVEVALGWRLAFVIRVRLRMLSTCTRIVVTLCDERGRVVCAGLSVGFSGRDDHTRLF